MKKTMAAVLEATGGSLRLTELDIAGPKANEVAIRIVACDLCHSDYSCIHGIVRTPLPVVLGHEAGGIVEEVGPGVSDLEVGDHVIVALTPACGRCEFCVEEKPFLCTQMFATLGNCRCRTAPPACLATAARFTNCAPSAASPSARWSPRDAPCGSIPTSPSRRSA